jgi:hypothetical protein
MSVRTAGINPAARMSELYARKNKGPGWLCETCQPGPVFGEDGRGSGHGVIRL